MSKGNTFGSSDDITLMRYMTEVENMTSDPVERWAFLKGMILMMDREREYRRKYQRAYKVRKLASDKAADNE